MNYQCGHVRQAIVSDVAGELATVKVPLPCADPYCPESSLGQMLKVYRVADASPEKVEVDVLLNRSPGPDGWRWRRE